MPDLVFRFSGYGGLAALIAARLAASGDDRLWLPLATTVVWPGLWWWLVRRHPRLRSTGTAASRLAYGAECAMVMVVAVGSGFDLWLTIAIGLAMLTGVTALGGLALLGPCAVTVALVLFYQSQSVVPSPDPHAIAGGMVVAGFLLGLALLSFKRVRRLSDRRRSALVETAALEVRSERLARYLPGGLLPLVEARPTDINPPVERFVTVAFIDVVGFVELVASRPLAELVDVLNDFIGTVAGLAERRGGVLSKFLGDGVLVYFPEQDGSERRQCALRCARLCLDLGEALGTLSAGWRRRGLVIDLKTRAGLASGYCAIGDWGSGPRLDYTPIGTPVNLASRLQGAAPESGILVAANTAALLAEDAGIRDRMGQGRRLLLSGFGGCMAYELSANVRANPMSTAPHDGQDISQGLQG